MIAKKPKIHHSHDLHSTKHHSKRYLISFIFSVPFLLYSVVIVSFYFTKNLKKDDQKQLEKHNPTSVQIILDNIVPKTEPEPQTIQNEQEPNQTPQKTEQPQELKPSVIQKQVKKYDAVIKPTEKQQRPKKQHAIEKVNNDFSNQEANYSNSIIKKQSFNVEQNFFERSNYSEKNLEKIDKKPKFQEVNDNFAKSNYDPNSINIPQKEVLTNKEQFKASNYKSDIKDTRSENIKTETQNFSSARYNPNSTNIKQRSEESVKTESEKFSSARYNTSKFKDKSEEENYEEIQSNFQGAKYNKDEFKQKAEAQNYAQNKAFSSASYKPDSIDIKSRSSNKYSTVKNFVPSTYKMKDLKDKIKQAYSSGGLSGGDFKKYSTSSGISAQKSKFNVESSNLNAGQFDYSQLISTWDAEMKIEIEKRKYAAQASKAKIAKEVYKRQDNAKTNNVKFEPKKAFKNPESPDPIYPLEAELNGYDGTIVILIEVDSEGNVSSLKTIKSTGYPILDEEALRVVKDEWSFYPAFDSSGKPVSDKIETSINFTLSGS